MIVVYIAFGILSGLVTAAVALFSGFGIIGALIAYILGGAIGMILGLVCVSTPKPNNSAKQAATQRS